MFLRTATTKSMNACYDKKSPLKQELETADAVVIGAGAGLSTSAGFTYAGLYAQAQSLYGGPG